MWHVVVGWHAIEFAQTSAILEFYIWFPFPNITGVDMSFRTSLRNFIQIGPPSAEKNDVMSIFKMASIDTIALNCLVFEKIAFLHFGDRQTDRQTKGVFIATQLNWTQLTQLNSVQPSQSCFCLWRHDLQTESIVVHAVELSSVELCRYKHPFKGFHSNVLSEWGQGQSAIGMTMEALQLVLDK